jgi:transcription elongation factor Elf1
MNQQERDALRHKHRKLWDETCRWCVEDRVLYCKTCGTDYPCDVIKVLDQLDIEYGDGYDAGYEDGRKHGPETWV